jgi:hypothetical protein
MAGKPRVHEIAREYRTDAKVVLKTLRSMGEYVKAPSSSIPPPVARKLKSVLEQNGHSTPVFPALDGDGGITALSLATALPRRMPELVDLLISGRHTDAAVPDAIELAAEARWFFYSPTRSFGAVKTASEDVTALHEVDLPSPSGVAIITQADNRGATSLRLIAWRVEPSQVRAATTTLITATDADGLRLVATRSRVTSSPRGSDDAFQVAEDSPLRLLGGLWATLPDRLPPREEPRTQTTAGEGRDTSPDREDGTHLIYATRSALGMPAGDSAGKPRTGRWKVRGHWRQQWYPAEGGHKRIWIEDHTAGAVDVDAVRRERVYVVAPRVDSTAQNTGS